jgi:hypothetical protein
MQRFSCGRTLFSAYLVAFGLALASPVAGAATKPDPKAKKGFQLFARAGGSLRVNAVQCGIISNGQICVDSTGSSTIPGSVWPKGTNNQYTFNSGIQFTAIVGDEMPAWAGDTTGAPFFEGSGFILAGEQVEPIYNASDPEDLANWPEFARVPGAGDAVADIYDPLLQGQVSASQGDVYFLTWDGNPSRISGRTHPMGIVVETRGLAWNFPAGNQDIMYFIYSIYNITSIEREDYVNIRDPLKDRLLQAATEFHAANEAAFGVDIPNGGYTLRDVFMAFAADQDVTVDAPNNFSSFNNLFDLAVTYHATFQPAPGNLFDPGIHAPPFLPAPGFVGTKYLRSPILPDGTESGTVLAGLTTNRGAFPDAASVNQMYRYLSGNLNPAAGDPQCNTGDPDVTGICFINTQPSDTRTFQSSGPLTLPPGGQATIVVAYIFAPPVSTGKCSSIPCPVQMTPNPLLISNATPDNPGADAIDSAMGYRGFKAGTDTLVQDSVVTVPRSLLDKAIVAQRIFDSKFLLPFGPQAPEFYLVPGDNQVTILWQPTPSETTGDAFFAIANDPSRGVQYDPSYRQFDVEGYRIYRGRTDTPNSLELVAQFDYDNTVIYDFRGTINFASDCAPEVQPPVVSGCAALGASQDFPIPPSGARFTDSVAVNITGPIAQVRLPGRVALADGQALPLNGATDTLITSLAVSTLATGAPAAAVRFPALANTGVPFAFTDDGSGLVGAPRNNVRYFYSVTAFDVNSFQSGPSSLESQRIARAVVPTRSAPNVATAELQSGLFGDDGVALDPDAEYVIDPATGRFTGSPPPTDGVEGIFAPLVPVLLPALSLTATIDSVKARGTVDPICGGVSGSGLFPAPGGSCYIYYVTFNRDGTRTSFVSVQGAPIWSSFGEATSVTGQLGALPVLPDPGVASRYGIPEGAGASNAAVGATLRQSIDWSSFEGQAARRGRIGNNNQVPVACPAADNCAASASPGGSRWFSGTDETVDHPAVSIRVGSGLPGVDTVWAPIHHVDQDPLTPDGQGDPVNSAVIQFFGYGFAALGRQADVQFTWGEGGTLTSVRDLTHHVPVLFAPDLGASYGFVSDASGDGKVTWEDFNFIPGVAGFWIQNVGANGPTDPAQEVPLAATPTVGAVSTSFDPAAAATGQGFGLYINGERYIFQLTGGALPAAGTQWTLRTYTGTVSASTGGASATPSGYAFTPRTRSPVVPGLQVQFTVEQPTQVASVAGGDLSNVHTVPDPYYVTSEYETTTTDKIIRFVNLPTQAIIRIYSSSGVLVRVLTHNSNQRGDRDEDVSVLGGETTWDVRNRNNQVVASGVYFYHIESGDARRVGRFTVVNFSQ